MSGKNIALCCLTVRNCFELKPLIYTHNSSCSTIVHYPVVPNSSIYSTHELAGVRYKLFDASDVELSLIHI